MSQTDIRAFVASLKSRSPGEVMGDAATSRLAPSMIKSAIGWTAVMLGMTAMVYLVGGGPPAKTETAEASQDPATPAAVPVSNPSPEEASDASSTETTGSNNDRAVEAMGIGETKSPDAKPETMENRLDQILDGLE